MANSGFGEYPVTGGSVTSPLGVVRSSYDRIAGQALPVDPRPVPAVHGSRNPVESWDALRERLRDAAVPIAEVDAIWVWLIERSRMHGQDATLVCACLAEPMLAKTVRAVATRRDTRRHDIESEVLTGFLTHLESVELQRPHLWHRLRWVAYRYAIAAANQWESIVLSGDIDRDLGEISEARVMVSEPGHPETVLAQAIAAGVITEAAAELIAVSRWERRSLTSLAAEREQSVWALRKRRRRAERALLAWLTERALDLDRTSVVEAHAVTALERTDSLTAAPPRRGRRPRPDSPSAPARTNTEHGQVQA